VPRISVEPTEFILVNYSAEEIRSIADRIATAVGFPEDQQIVIDVEESTPLTRVVLKSASPLEIAVEGGAFEDPKRPRQLSVSATETTLARALFEAHDRLAGGFADAPVQGVTLAQQTAWDVYCYGRSERLHLTVQPQVRLYAFRNRHGCSDASDAVFDRLWNTPSLTWDDICAACNETAASAS
jgi:hypothetical protein